MSAGPLLLVRHCQSTWNAERRWAGEADPPLTAEGRRQARAFGDRIRWLPIERVVSSPQLRATETAAPSAQDLGLPIEPDGRLRERSMAGLSGLTEAEIDAQHPGTVAAWRRGQLTELPGGAEPWSAFSSRVLEGLQEAHEHGGMTLVVAHSGVVRVALHSAGLPPAAPANAAAHWVTVLDGRWDVTPLT